MKSKWNNIETDILERGLVIIHMNDKIRLKILQFYYNLYMKDSTSFSRYYHFVEELNIPKNELVGHVKYLNDKQLLDCICTSAIHEIGKPLECKITSHGIDAIEHPELFVREIPALNLIINSSINNSSILQGQSIRIENGFNHVYQAIEESDLDENCKKEVENNVRELESEGKKKEPNINKMKQLLERVRKVMPTVYDLLKPLIQKYIETMIGLDTR